MHGKTVAIDGRDFTVDERTYEAVRRLVESGAICRECGKRYEAENPKVHCNTCLRCYLSSHVCREKSYRFLSIRRYSDTYSYAQFISPSGYIHEVSPEETSRFIREPDRDEWQTLLYWNYSLPFPYAEGKAGEYDSVTIHTGKPAERVIVVNFFKRFGNGNSAIYLLTDDGAPPMELHKRTSAMRAFWKTATERAKRFQHSDALHAIYTEMVKMKLEERILASK